MGISNQSARNAQIIIDGKDFTPCLMSFQGSDSHLDNSGFITFTGKIILGQALDFDESLDDRKNSRRFCRGNKIDLFVANSSNLLAKHPRGALRILSSKYDYEKQQLELSVADLITLLNFKEPTDPDKADNKECQGKPASTVIVNLLREAGITSIAGFLPNTTYNYPLNLSGSYLQSAGKLLYANNLFGWIDKNEILQIESADIRYKGSSINLVIGRDEVWYKRLEGAEAPVEKIKGVGNQRIVIPAPDKIEYVTEEYGPASTVDIEYGNFAIVLQRVKRTQAWDKQTHKLTIRTKTYLPYAQVINEAFWGEVTPKLKLTLNEEVHEILTFEKEQCKLIYKEIKTYKNRGSYLGEFKESRPNYIFLELDYNLSKWVRQTYTYDNKDRLQKIKTKTSELGIIILNGTAENWSEDNWNSPPEYLIPSANGIEEWVELNKNTWEYHTNLFEPVIRVKPDSAQEDEESETNNKLLLIYSKGERRISNSGQELPPAPERCPPECTFEDSQIEQEIKFFDSCASSLKPRERTINVDFLAGKLEQPLKIGEVRLYSINGGSGSQAANQLLKIARREGALLRGRYKGQSIAAPLISGIFNYKPLMGIRAFEKYSIESYLADGTSWVLSTEKALWSTDGIWIGSHRRSVPESDPVTETEINEIQANDAPVITPFQIVESVNLTHAQAIDFKSYSYDISPIVSNFNLAQAQSINWEGSFNSLFWEDSEWDSLDENAWNNLDSQPTWNSANWDNVDWDNLG